MKKSHESLTGFGARSTSQTHLAPNAAQEVSSSAREARERSRPRCKVSRCICATYEGAGKLGKRRAICSTYIDSFHQVRELGDDQLIEQLKTVLSRQRCLTAELVSHLSEVEVRGIHLRLGFGSMHEYCVAALQMSDDEAYVRVRAARLSRDYPAVLVMLAKGEIHLSALKLLAPHLSEENCAELLGAARFATKREVDRLVSTYAPKPDVKNEVRKLPSTPLVQATLQEQQPLREPASSLNTDANQSLLLTSTAEKAPNTEVPSRTLKAENALRLPGAGSRPPAPPVTHLREDRYKVQFTADQQLRDKLKRAQELMRHQIPDGDIAKVCERALDLLIEHKLKQHGIGRKSRAPQPRTTKQPNPNSRHIPNEVKRQVLERDGEQCSYVSPDGRRCQQREWLEFHHKHPFACGGPATVDNVAVTCRAHNWMFAVDDYGYSLMRECVDRSRRERSAARLVPEPARGVASRGRRAFQRAGRSRS